MGNEIFVRKKVESTEGEGDKEMTPLLHQAWLLHNKSVLSKCHNFIIVNSKAAIMILIWNFAITLPYGILVIPNGYLKVFNFDIAAVISGFIAITLLFAPLVGFLADVKFGRYKTVLTSVLIIIIALSCILISIILLKVSTAYYLAFCILLGIFHIFYLIGSIGYLANILQFAMDQLRDAPSQDSVLFLHWHFWCYYVSITMTLGVMGIPGKRIVIDFFSNTFYFDTLRISLISAILLLAIVILVISLCLTCQKQNWFLIEPSSDNPYKLVYRVVKFAWHHKIPVRRSAFTYCEDEWPSRLDLGKQKYGGPFTVEQVEDVRAFIHTLKVILSVGPLFYLDGINTTTLIDHDRSDAQRFKLSGEIAKNILLFNGVLPSLLIVVCLPVYLCVLRPFISYWIPRTLKRIGIASALLCISFLLYFIISVALAPDHLKDVGIGYYCSRHENVTFNGSDVFRFSSFNTGHFVVQCILTALFRMLFYISAWEFICSQSPYSMKGMLFGVFYAIQGLFYFFAVMVPLFFLLFWKPSLLSCNSGYYLMNLIFAVFSLVVYVLVARGYKYRIRDEPPKVYQYAENYYSN